MNNRRLKSVLSACIVFAFVLVSCDTIMPASRARFESADCKFQIPAGISNNIDCGNLFVPEDRNHKDSPLIQLHVAIVRSRDQNPASDPVVYIHGGWGFPALGNIGNIVLKFQDVLKNRDLIVFDQRGAGYSEPSLDCPEIPAQVYQDTVQKIAPEERAQHYIEAARNCHDRLINAGIDLTAYTTLANAADVNDLRIALEYSEWNLYGISYGTRVALAVMRHSPKGVRSVILDSTYPPQTNVFIDEPNIVERSLELLAERCAADTVCDRKYPDLVPVFYDLVTQLDAEPRGYMNGNGLIETVWGFFYSAQYLPRIPKFLYELHDGNLTNLPPMSYALTSSKLPGPWTMSEGKRFSVICAEEVANASVEEIAAANRSVPPRLVEYFDEPIFEICSFWGAKPADPEESAAVVSDIPALILQGDYDPATPPSWGRLAAETLSKAHYFEFPGVSHYVLGTGPSGSCSKKIVDAFLADPMLIPDASCLKDMKPFFY